MKKQYDYNIERHWISTLFDMQLEHNKSTQLILNSFEMRLKRLEQIVEDISDIVYNDNNFETPTGLGMDISGKGRFKI